MNTDLVVVTGAAGALGKAVCAAFLERGARVLALDIGEEPLRAAYGGDGRVRTLAVDLVDAAKSRAAIAAALAADGPAAALCNIAGGFDMGPAVHEDDGALWRRMMDLNVATLVNASAAVAPGMLAAGRGAIVNVAAASAASGKAGMGAYIASKDAVARLTETMAQELRGRGVNVNAVAPSILDTPANRAAMPGADPAKWVALADLAAVIVFLASPQAKAVHGAVLPVLGLS
ncbi:SDR family NAD(P)-dependent oxidoreductase [Pseudoduganella namucuonensis]|uniref:NADP-dependent 3-hydroxy acid dehydrogenase YdfG n=1 Tax=Pseudoduganella namucuonensis TaxID=1035707 RepID=A0A1I7H8H2_9BURK|nr:SDR family NAD(P)-dependent oxidoreductase [Pseudoduganella namucuonensis]SFU57018.1 NADP-dependent 3-hydroxy acid dehydrogenase YdfG [Pseudoduganella namucuonensis]